MSFAAAWEWAKLLGCLFALLLLITPAVQIWRHSLPQDRPEKKKRRRER